MRGKIFFAKQASALRRTIRSLSLSKDTGSDITKWNWWMAIHCTAFSVAKITGSQGYTSIYNNIWLIYQQSGLDYLQKKTKKTKQNWTLLVEPFHLFNTVYRLWIKVCEFHIVQVVTRILILMFTYCVMCEYHFGTNESNTLRLRYDLSWTDMVWCLFTVKWMIATHYPHGFFWSCGFWLGAYHSSGATNRIEPLWRQR